MEEPSLEGKTAFVTGAGRGIGKAIALALLSHGARVAMTSTDLSTLEDVVAESGAPAGRTFVTAGNLESDDEAYRIARTVRSSFGAPDILVNNAGILSEAARKPGSTGPVKFRDVDPAFLRRFFQVNAIAPAIFASEFVGGMLEKGWGRVINISTSLDTMLNAVGYGPSKAAMEAHSAQLSRELEGTGVTVNALLPGGITATPGTRHSTIPQDKMLRPDVMIAPVVWLASTASDGVNGRRFVGALWDPNLPAREAAEKAGFPIAWTGYGPKAVPPT